MLPMRVVDLFAGLGGFTCGALEAGAEVMLVVDSDPAPLKVLGANAPTATAVVATLGEGRDRWTCHRPRQISTYTSRHPAPSFPLRAVTTRPTSMPGFR